MTPGASGSTFQRAGVVAEAAALALASSWSPDARSASVEAFYPGRF